MKIINKVFSDKYYVAIFLILLLATFLRFYDFPNRWGIGNDDARDISIAREAILRSELPLIGSFSSAGPFVFGPLFYWFIIGSYLFWPFNIFFPWIVIGLLGVVTVGILIYCAQLIGTKRFALIVGLLTATSPQLVARSMLLGQHTFIAVTTALLFLSYILFWQKKKLYFAFFMGLSLGIALSMHYQAINLLIFFPTIFAVPGLDIKKKLLAFIIMFIGFVIPSLPLLIWDSQQQFANIRNILDYLLIGQYRLYVPNSWRLFLFDYFPSYWAFVVGGYKITGIVFLFTFALSFMALGYKRKISKILFIFAAVFFVLFIINKNYHGERSEGYLIYFSPFIILFSAFVIESLLTGNIFFRYSRIIKYFGLLFLCITVFFNLFLISKFLMIKSPVNEFRKTAEILSKKYPNTKFTVYDYQYQSPYQSQPLGVFLKEKDKTDKNGMPIGVICPTKKCPQKFPVITTIGGANVVDLRKEKNLSDKGIWSNTNQEGMYDDLIGWSKKHELTSPFSLTKYLLRQ